MLAPGGWDRLLHLAPTVPSACSSAPATRKPPVVAGARWSFHRSFLAAALCSFPRRARLRRLRRRADRVPETPAQADALAARIRGALAEYGEPVPLAELGMRIDWCEEDRRIFGRLQRFVKRRPELWSTKGLVGERNTYSWVEQPRKSGFLRVIELFSGIGGLRAAFERACSLAGMAEVPQEEWLPMEASHLANSVYSRNFHVPYGPLLPTNVNTRQPEDLDFSDLWLLSPPCQPFTRIGKKLDTGDRRSEPLQHLVGLLPKLRRPPSALLLENVKNFETSESWELASRALVDLGYEVRQFLLSPLQLGIPNRRPRIYILARRREGEAGVLHDLEEEFPGSLAAAPKAARSIAEYLDPELETATELAAVPECLHVPREQLAKMATNFRRWEVVGPESTSSTTFTSGYSHLCPESNRFGPLLRLGAVIKRPGDRLEDGGRRHCKVLPGDPVRRFSDSEMLRIAGFPKGFQFPEGMTLKAHYQLIGDSINVDVVAHLVHYLVFEWTSLGDVLVGERSEQAAMSSAQPC